jgi:hypothetical protein
MLWIIILTTFNHFNLITSFTLWDIDKIDRSTDASFVISEF